jgi:hypothetical protein
MNVSSGCDVFYGERIEPNTFDVPRRTSFQDPLPAQGDWTYAAQVILPLKHNVPYLLDLSAGFSTLNAEFAAIAGEQPHKGMEALTVK